MTNETKVIEQRIIQRLIKTAADYELGGSLYSQVIPLHTQAYAIYDSQEKSGLYYVFGDGVHTYTEIRDGQSSLESSHEYAVFDDAWIALVNSKADLQYMNFELAKRQYISNLVNEITEENEKSTTLYPSVKASVNYIKNIADELKNDIDTESETRADADNLLQSNIDNEKSARISADTTLQDNIDAEVTARQNQDNVLSTNIANEAATRLSNDTTLQNNIDTEVTNRQNALSNLSDELVAENTRAINAEGALDENKADKTALTQEISDRQINDTKIINNIWSNSTMNGGTFKTKYTADNGSYALLFNESDGGGTQYYNKNLDSLQYVGVNDGNDGVYVQIYAKNKTTNEGARLAASPSGIFYTNGKKNGSYVATDEIVTKAVLSSAVDVKANSADVYTKTEIDSKLTSAMHFKGTKLTYNDLPKSNMETGDVWNILDTGENYAWDGENWDKLSETIDLSPYALTEDVDEKILTEKDRREDADTELSNAIAAEKTRAETAEDSLQETKADKSDVYTKIEVDNKDQAIKDDIYGRIWSKPSNPSQGHLYTKMTNSAGGYALIFNESDGGGSQVYDKTDDIISYVGTNLEEGTGADNGVNVQIYSKNKTTNEGVRFNVNNQKAYYLKGASKTNIPEREVAVIENIPTKTSDLTNDSDYTTNEALQAQVTSLTQQIKDLKLLIPTEVFDVATAKTALNKAGKVTLYSDIDLGTYAIVNGTFASNNTTINLNSYKIECAPNNGRSIFMLRGSTNYTFNGNGQVIDTASNSACLWTTTENNVCTINNGTWTSQHTECIYCEKGTITIKGGEFKTESDDKRYLLNCKDSNYQAGTAKIIVKGGKFWDFDPHDCAAEGEHTNFCADSYTTTSEIIDGHTIYTVVKA